MDIQQTSELTYAKVSEIDNKINEMLDVVTENNPESSSSLKETINEIKTKTENILENQNDLKNNLNEIDSISKNIKSDTENIIEKVDNNSTKLDTLLSNQGNQGGNSSVDFSSLETKIDTANETITNIETTVNTINTITSNINSNSTTTNSNVATIRNNVDTILNDVENIKDTVPEKNFKHEVSQKLDEILKSVKDIQGADNFTDDPFKLELPYNGKIETSRNPSNYDFIEITKEHNVKGYLLLCVAHCTSPTFDYNFEMTFSTDEIATMNLATNFVSSTTNTSYAIGTNTITLSKQNVSVVDNKIVFAYQSYTDIKIHHLKLELFGENICILPKRNKFKIAYGLDKLIISKTEDFTGYYLILDNKHALTPDKLNQEFTKDLENVKDYSLGYDLFNYKNTDYSLSPVRCYIDMNSKFNYIVGNNYYSHYDISTYSLVCNYAYSDFSNSIVSAVTFYQPLIPHGFFYTIEAGNGTKRTYLSLQSGNVCDSKMAIDYKNFDTTKKTAHLLTTIDGQIYFGFSSTYFIALGYGKNPTGFIHADERKINVYMNDGGYCVKKVIQYSEDKTQLQLLSETIIGTYDAYFETNNDVYIVEKDEKLYMFKK